MTLNPQESRTGLQRQFEQKSFEIHYFRTQAQDLQTQVQIVQKALEELENAKKTLSSSGFLSQGALLALGAGVYAKAKAEKTDAVLINVGANVLAEKNPQEATSILDARKTDAQKSLAELAAALERVLERIAQLTDQAEQIAAASQRNANI